MRGVKVGARAICAWAVIAMVVVGAHLSLFAAEFRESWYAPLHFLWVVACASGASWWCVRPCERRAASVWLSVLFVVFSCGLTWAVARVPWGGGIVGEKAVPLVGAVLVCASFILAGVSVLLATGSLALSGKASDSEF